MTAGERQGLYLKPDYSTLFEQQSYRDALEYYQQTLSSQELPVWDYCILTASNPQQAHGYEMQIAERLKDHRIPESTHYAVIPDLDGKRIGSGGATLSCIKYVKEHAGTFSGKRILVIHSGGDSKRIPQYSVCGKLFSPVPRLLPDGHRSTLFDEFLIGMSTAASRISDGMLVCSGDVLLQFNSLQIDFYGAEAAALSIKEDVATGKNHGVYLSDENGHVGRFLHKQTVEKLSSVGAVDARGKVDIDTGAVIMNTILLDTLYSLIDTDEKYHSYVNEKARLSFYADFLYPLASGSTLEQYYREQPEGDFTDELHDCRTVLWEQLHPYHMKLIRLSPASFLHFGTTKELLKLMTDDMEKYRFLDWKRSIHANLVPKGCAVSNSYISHKAVIGEGCYIEDSRVLVGSKVGAHCVISGVTLENAIVPDGTVLHGLKLSDERFVCRVYGVGDNPKENTLMGADIGEPLWTANIYPICDTIGDAVTASLAAVKQVTASSPRTGISLCDSFNNADVSAILPWQENLYEQVAAEAVLEMIKNGVPANIVRESGFTLDSHSVEYLLKKAESKNTADIGEFGTCIRIYAYLSVLLDNPKEKRAMSDRCFSVIRNATLAASKQSIGYHEDYRLCEDVTVQLPVRVNWGGGWSDTPPYCMEHGGTVLNAAVKVNGNLPIEVTVRRFDKPVIALASTDIGSYKEFTDISQLTDCRNPSDPFALHKAALIACGVIPDSGENTPTVEEICAHLGSGLYMNTRVIDIPKGSGLGTSSILAGACVKAIYAAMGEEISDELVIEKVLCLEQLMSTGGGWQDQVGGILPGIKLIQSKVGVSQKVQYSQVNIDEETLAELNERFAIIYTGQRRLARNLLRDVVTKYICADPDSLQAHYNIQRLAMLMRFELEKGNIDGFAHLLTDHWQESLCIDSGSTNTCIDQIFTVIEDLTEGKMICGAGGGGFLQVILKKGVTKDALRERLREVFQDSGVDVWNCELV